MRGSIRWVATAVVGVLPAACGGSGGSPHLPDGDFVVYWADGETPGVVEAYVSDATGVHRRKVAGPTILDGDVLRVEWSPDRTRLAVLGDLETDGKSELYLVDPNADVPALEKISGVGAQAGVGSVADFEWSPDGARIAFTKAQDGVGRLDLFTVLSSGAAAIVRVSAPITATGTSVGVIDFWWRPFANVLAYKADLAIDNTFDLFVVGATGSGRASNIQVGMPVDDDVLTVAWAPDGSRLAFTYKESGASGGGSLFTCPPNGVGAIKLTDFFSTNRTVSDWQWAPDSTRLLYTADTFIEERIDLFVVEADGGATTTLVTMAADSDVIFPSWSPDSTRIAFGVIDALTNSWNRTCRSIDGRCLGHRRHRRRGGRQSRRSAPLVSQRPRDHVRSPPPEPSRHAAGTPRRQARRQRPPCARLVPARGICRRRALVAGLRAPALQLLFRPRHQPAKRPHRRPRGRISPPSERRAQRDQRARERVPHGVERRRRLRGLPRRRAFGGARSIRSGSSSRARPLRSRPN